MFQGSTVALVTPVKNGQVDYESLESLVEFQIEQGTDVLLPCGCTGEAATLSHDEQKQMIKFVIEKAAGRVPVMAGTGSNNTAEAVELTRFAKDAGADGALLITPYYNKPTQGGLYEHYALVAKEVAIPIILYNVPGRTAVSLAPETIAKLSKIENIVAVKEASGSLDQVSQILGLCDIDVLSGDDALTIPMMSLGAKGVVSVAANIVPKQMSDLVKLFADGKLDEARKLHFSLLPLFKALFMETNPIPVKSALGMMGMITADFRLPLCPLKVENEAPLRAVLEQCDVAVRAGGAA